MADFLDLVSNTPYYLQIFWIAWVDFDFFPDPSDMYHHGVLDVIRRFFPDALIYFLCGKNSSGIP